MWEGRGCGRVVFGRLFGWLLGTGVIGKGDEQVEWEMFFRGYLKPFLAVGCPLSFARVYCLQWEVVLVACVLGTIKVAHEMEGSSFSQSYAQSMDMRQTRTHRG